MNIFSILYDVIHYKRGDVLETIEDEKELSIYMLQRWLSMYSPEFANIVNCSSNVLWRGLDNKQQWYKLFLTVIPKSSVKRFAYLKKNTKAKKEKEVDDEYTGYLAEHLEVSQREVKELIKQEELTTKDLKKLLGE